MSQSEETQPQADPQATEVKNEEEKQAETADIPLTADSAAKTAADSEDILNAPSNAEPVNVGGTEPLVVQQQIASIENYFRASDFEQPPELKEFLKEKLANPYNKYCIDCKKNQTTHSLIWLGVFVCANCANIHRLNFGGQSQNYIKEVNKDHWDDYQLRSIQIGGNKPLFDLFKEYNIENEELIVKYRHACVKWYKQSHVSKMDGVAFNEAKPPKDWNERLGNAKASLAKNSVQWGENLKIIGGHIKSGAQKAGTNVKSLSQKAKEKEIGNKMGQRLSTFFKKGNRSSSIVEPPLVEDDPKFSNPVLEDDKPKEEENKDKE